MESIRASYIVAGRAHHQTSPIRAWQRLTENFLLAHLPVLVVVVVLVFAVLPSYRLAEIGLLGHVARLEYIWLNRNHK